MYDNEENDNECQRWHSNHNAQGWYLNFSGFSYQTFSCQTKYYNVIHTVFCSTQETFFKHFLEMLKWCM